MSEVIVRTNGDPYASEATARQQMKAKGFTDATHEPVRQAWGWGIARRGNDEPVTLRPGDHVSTKHMDIEKYHGAAKAFMAAGAKSDEYCADDDDMDYKVWEYVGWSLRGPDNGVSHHDAGYFFGDENRLLTIYQVLNATNAGEKQDSKCCDVEFSIEGTEVDVTKLSDMILNSSSQQEKHMSIIEALKSARAERDAAEKAYQEALSAVRDELGAEFTLVDNGAEDSPVGELPPEEWREGDLVECVVDQALDLTRGKTYEIVADKQDGKLIVIDDAGDKSEFVGSRGRLGFRFHSRP